VVSRAAVTVISEGATCGPELPAVPPSTSRSDKRGRPSRPHWLTLAHLLAGLRNGARPPLIQVDVIGGPFSADAGNRFTYRNTTAQQPMRNALSSIPLAQVNLPGRRTPFPLMFVTQTADTLQETGLPDVLTRWEASRD